MDFTSKDLCDIIKVCSEAGVSCFKMDTLEISFMGKHIETPFVAADVPGQVTSNNEKNEAEELAKNTRESKEELLSRMLLEDPVLYEKLQLDGELEDEDQQDEK